VQKIEVHKKNDINFLFETKKVEKPINSKDLSPKNKRPVQV